jgi:DNA-directed RNA polymerase subunit RPC12/RpoP
MTDAGMRRSSPRTRYVDQGALLVGFARKVISVCPKCDGPVLVDAESKWALPYQPTNVRLTCGNCSFQRRANESDWLGPLVGIAKARCQYCGHKWLKKEVHRNAVANSSGNKAKKSTLPHTVELCCPSCEHKSRLEIEWHEMRFGAAIDPIVGLPLWLQTPCCGETFWAYNAPHLKKLRAYISASLRERTIGTHASTFQRLPGWMIAAKNRDKVLKCIDSLESRLQSPGIPISER